MSEKSKTEKVIEGYRKRYPEFYDEAGNYIGPEMDKNGKTMAPWLEQKLLDYELIHESDRELDKNSLEAFNNSLKAWKRKRPLMWFVGFLLVSVPGVLLGLGLLPFAGAVFGGLGAGLSYSLLSGVLIWLAIIVALGFRVVPSMEAQVVERLGNYYRTLNSGPRILLPFLDKVVNVVDLKKQEIRLYQDEGVNHAWDFTNASAGGTAKAYYKVKDPVKWTYAFSDPVGRIEERFDSTVRPMLQLLDIDNAQIHKTRISQWASDFLRESMENNLGAEVERMLITDIDVPPEAQEARMKRLVGEKTAQETRARQLGYAQAINDLIEELKAGIPEGVEIPYERLREEAMKIFEQQQGLDAVRNTGSNISLIGLDVPSVIKSLMGGK